MNHCDHDPHLCHVAQILHGDCVAEQVSHPLAGTFSVVAVTLFGDCLVMQEVAVTQIPVSWTLVASVVDFSPWNPGRLFRSFAVVTEIVELA